ncbi:MAG TPA: DUF4342 domain-containing protein [Pseudonocardiaceae bacterium]
MTVEQRDKNTAWLGGQELVDRIRSLLHEGNVRRLVLRDRKGNTVMEIPVTAGVLIAIAAPALSAVGALAGLAGGWSIQVERRDDQE